MLSDLGTSSEVRHVAFRYFNATGADRAGEIGDPDQLVANPGTAKAALHSHVIIYRKHPKHRMGLEHTSIMNLDLPKLKVQVQREFKCHF
jgi:hypothetical protein